MAAAPLDICHIGSLREENRVRFSLQVVLITTRRDFVHSLPFASGGEYDIRSAARLEKTFLCVSGRKMVKAECGPKSE